VAALRLTRIITRLNVGGPARQELSLSPELKPLGIDDELLHGSVERSEGELVPPAALQAVRVPSLRRDVDPLADARALRAIGRHLRARRPSVVHTHMAKAGALGRIAARRAGVPMVVVHTFHGHVLEGYFSKARARAVLAAERALARRTDALIAVSPQVRDELLELGVGSPERWFVIPLGLDLEPFDRIPAPTEARLSLGLPTEGPIVGIVGRLVPIKDHDTFLAAAATVARSDPSVTFVIAGDGDRRAELERRAELLLGDRCRFLGWTLDLPNLYAALDVVVLTSRKEGTPVALLEAAAAERPVVATRVGGVPDAVEHGVTGVLVAPGDGKAVAANVLSLLRDEERGRRMGAAGRDRVLERHEISRVATELVALYRECLGRRDR
jgi:glycosyltransferase involved in cell wall biosynthesis